MEPTHDLSHLTERLGGRGGQKIGKSEEKGLSPSKNYQVLTTSLGKNLPPSLLPKVRRNALKLWDGISQQFSPLWETPKY